MLPDPQVGLRCTGMNHREQDGGYGPVGTIPEYDAHISRTAFQTITRAASQARPLLHSRNDDPVYQAGHTHTRHPKTLRPEGPGKIWLHYSWRLE